MRVRVQPLAAPPVRDVPNSNRFVVAGRQEVLAARMPGQTANPVVVAEQGEEADPGGDVPDLYALVARPGSQKRSDYPALTSHVIVASASFASLQ